MLVTVDFVFFQVHIIGVVFLILRVTFLEKFCLLCNLVSCLIVYHSELRQNKDSSLRFMSDSSCNRVLPMFF